MIRLSSRNPKKINRKTIFSDNGAAHVIIDTRKRGAKVPWTSIPKDPASFPKPPNLPDYFQTAAAFSWDAVRAELQGLPEGRGQIGRAHV